MICPKCKGAKHFHLPAPYGITKCSRCNGTGKEPKETNEISVLFDDECEDE